MKILLQDLMKTLNMNSEKLKEKEYFSYYKKKISKKII